MLAPLLLAAAQLPAGTATVDSEGTDPKKSGVCVDAWRVMMSYLLVSVF